MLERSGFLLFLVFFIAFGNAVKPPFPDPVEGEEHPEVGEVGGASVAAPATDPIRGIPARLKGPRILRQPLTDGGVESPPSVDGSGGAAGNSTPPTPSSPGSGMLLGESPKSRGSHAVSGSGSDEKTPNPTTVQGKGTLLDDSPKSRGHKEPTIGGSSGNTGDQSTPSTSDGTRKPPSLKPSEGSAPTGSTGQTSPKTPAAGVPACDSMPAGADKVPFDCFDQAKLKDYCTNTFGGSTQTVPVSPGSKKFGIKRYTIDTTIKANWFQALALCQVRNMSLATVESYEDQKTLSSVLNNAGIQNAWLSANDLGQTNKYMWMSTGRPVVWSNWFDGEPNHENAGNQTEHCVEVINYRWRWNDNFCDNQEFFVCQYYSDK